MGFWSTFFCDQQCKCCGSYNTRYVAKNTREWNDAMDYLYTRSHYNGTISKLYKCDDCDEFTWRDAYDKVWWSSPKDD